jgi:DNA ligase-1
MIETLDTIYKRTSTGAVQIWYGELDGEGRYRTSSGQQGGVITTSEWTVAEAKNVGRSNATTEIEQARLELESKYRDRLEKDYHRDVNNIDTVRFVSPMLADKWEDKFHHIRNGELVFLQPKLDGFRAIAQFSHLAKHNVVFNSRNGKPFLGPVHLAEALSPLFQRQPDLILDGELYNHDHKDQFEALSSGIKKEPKTPELMERARRVVQYHVYDLPSSSNDNYGSRYAALDELFSNEPELQSDMFHLVENHSIIWDGDAAQMNDIVSEFLERGYEGGMAKRNTPYVFKRTPHLLKVKNFMEEEFEIVGIEEGKGNWTGCAKRVFISVPTAPVVLNDWIINRDTGVVEKFDGAQKNYQRASKATPTGTQDEMRRVAQEIGKYIGSYCTLKFFRYTESGVPYLPIIKTMKRIDDPRNN